jgi:hypothetical protein
VNPKSALRDAIEPKIPLVICDDSQSARLLSPTKEPHNGTSSRQAIGPQDMSHDTTTS